MWADTDTNIDYINYTETAEIAADLIRQPRMLPLSLGVFGGWGAGKSSMLRLIKKELLGQPPSDESDFIIIEFDAWLFQDYDDARASLMEIIARDLIEASKADENLLDKAKGLLKRVNYLRAIGTSVEIGASLALGIPPMGILGRGIQAVGNLLSDDADRPEAAQQAKEAMLEGGKFAKGLLKEEDSSPPQQINAFREHFGEVLQGLGKTLVVFIDNLDRCLPDVAIETLEAIRLFLFLDNTAFVIAADEDMIRASVRRHYHGIDSQHITDYLDKLIQVPIKVPLLGVQEVQAYTSLLFLAADNEGDKILDNVRRYLREQIMNSWNDATIDNAKIVKQFGITSKELKASLDLSYRLAPLLTSAPNISGNPRTIKRLLNTIKMRSSLAAKRKMPLDEALLTKLAVFERCTSDKSYEYLANIIHDAKDGKPVELINIEALVDDYMAFTEALPSEWKTDSDFLIKWFQLEPKLSDWDLRPAMYLSRESARLTTKSTGLSPGANKVFKALLSVEIISSPGAREAINSVNDDDKAQIMRLLVEELRKTTDWTKAPPGFMGAVLLANMAPHLGETLLLFLNGLPDGTVGMWAYPALRKEEWAKDMLAHWKKSGRNPIQPFKFDA